MLLVSSTCVCVHGLFEAPTRIRGAARACGVAGADAHDLGADTPGRRVPDRGGSCNMCESIFARLWAVAVGALAGLSLLRMRR